MTDIEKLKHHLRWLNGDTKEPNVLTLEKGLIESLIKKLEEIEFKTDTFRQAIIKNKAFFDYQLETLEDNQKMLMLTLEDLK